MRRLPLWPCLIAGVCAGAPLARASGPLDAVRTLAVHAIHRLEARNPRLRATWNSARPWSVNLRGLNERTVGAHASERAASFLTSNPELLAAIDATDRGALSPASVRATDSRQVVKFSQVHRGVPVEQGGVMVVLDSAGDVRAVDVMLVPVTIAGDLSKPKLRPAEAIGSVQRQLYGKRPRPATGSGGSADLVIIGAGETQRLCYFVVLPLGEDPAGRRHLVDAQSGVYVGWRLGMLSEGGVEVSR